MVMTLQAKPKRANLSISTEGNKTCCELRIDCSPGLLTRGVWEIGDRHVFANRANRPLFSKRKLCNLVVTVYRQRDVTSEDIGKLGQSDSRIGALVFVPPFKGDLMWRLYPAILEANVHVGDEFFDRLVGALQSGKKAKWLELEIEKQGALEYGWEPDGSRIIWKLESTTESSWVNVESIDIGIETF
jgi:hypothetical protein